MVETHLQDLQSLLERVAPNLAPGTALECKHFFSGAAVYAGGRVFMSLTPAGLALKLPAEARQQLTEAGARPLRNFPKGPIKKEYVVLPEKLARDDNALVPWIEESIRYTSARAGTG